MNGSLTFKRKRSRWSLKESIFSHQIEKTRREGEESCTPAVMGIHNCKFRLGCLFTLQVEREGCMFREANNFRVIQTNKSPLSIVSLQTKQLLGRVLIHAPSSINVESSWCHDDGGRRQARLGLRFISSSHGCLIISGRLGRSPWQPVKLGASWQLERREREAIAS